MSFPTHWGLAGLAARLTQPLLDLGFRGDSFARVQGSDMARIADQIVVGIEIYPFDGIVESVQDAADRMFLVDTADEWDAKTLDTNYHWIDATESVGKGGYRLDEPDSTVYWAVPVWAGVSVLNDATLKYGLSSRVFSVKTQAAGTPVWDHANSVNTWNITGIPTNGMLFWPVYVPTAADTTHDADLQMDDGSAVRWGSGGSQGAALNYKADARGKLHLGESMDVGIVPDYGHANALLPTIVSTALPTGRMTFNMYSGVTSPTQEPSVAHNDGRSQNLVNIVGVARKADGTPGDGTVVYSSGGASWDTSGVTGAAAATSATDKRFDANQFKHWRSSIRTSAGRTEVIFWTFDAEAETAAAIKSNLLAAMALCDAWADEAGEARPYHVWLGPVAKATPTNAYNMNQGYYDAVREHGYSAFHSDFKALYGAYLDDASADELTALAWALAGTTQSDSTDFTAGTVENVNLTLAALLDPVHWTEYGSALGMFLLKSSMIEADAGPGDDNTTALLRDEIGARHYFDLNLTSGTWTDAIGGATLAIDANITTGEDPLSSGGGYSVLGTASTGYTRSSGLQLRPDAAQPPMSQRWAVGCRFSLDGAPTGTDACVWALGDSAGSGPRIWTALTINTSGSAYMRVPGAGNFGTLDVSAYLDGQPHTLIVQTWPSAHGGDNLFYYSIDGGDFVAGTGAAAVNGTPTVMGLGLLAWAVGGRPGVGIGLDKVFVVDDLLGDSTAAQNQVAAVHAQLSLGSQTPHTHLRRLAGTSWGYPRRTR